MKNSIAIFTFLLVIFASYWAIESATPTYKPDTNSPETEFSTDRAFEHVAEMSREPHAVGFKAHQTVRQYVMSQLEKLGLEPVLQEGYTAGDWANFSKAINVMARIKGSEPGKALLLLSHYDSNPHSSLGASDAASGVATILESVRAYLATGAIPKNDIILLFTDAEELGLNGADLFVNNHPWIKDVGLVLNFEARGSGGPSFMLIETNQGNTRLIEEFSAAELDYPLGNSLAYSIYKLLPNDTDLTVFREDADIEGFNFAFIDDHYDYHSALDRADRLDKNSLAHQGSYLLPLLTHFSQTDLANLRSDADLVYFTVPFFGLVSYPFSWIWPMLAITSIVFLLLLVRGLRRKKLKLQGVFLGFIPLILVLATNGFIGYFSWPALRELYPLYTDMQQGFTYNGHDYIWALAFLTAGICFLIYQKFQKISREDLMVAPIILWLIISGLAAEYLPGASFVMIPVIAFLVAFLVCLNQKDPNPYLLIFLSLPAIAILIPFLEMFPIGLGLKLLVSATLIATLLFLLLLPLFVSYKIKSRLGVILMLIAVGFLISAHRNSDFDPERPKPTSLVYLLNTEKETASWATYEKVPAFWTSQYAGKDDTLSAGISDQTLSSKYASRFTFRAKAPVKPIPPPDIDILQNEVQGADRQVRLQVTSNRPVNRLEVFSNFRDFKNVSINGYILSDKYLRSRKRSRLLTHYISGNDSTVLEMTIPRDSLVNLTFYEASNDLLNHMDFSIPNRPDHLIPMPFVLNDAVILIRSVSVGNTNVGSGADQ